MWVIRPKRLSQNITDAHGFHNGSHRTSGDNASSFRSWLQEHAPSPESPEYVMRDCGAIYSHMNESLFRAFNTLTDGFGHLIGLAHTDPDSSITIANHYKGAKAKTPPPLNDFSDPIDVDDLIDEFGRWFALP
jgi:hypothetical protein